MGTVITMRTAAVPASAMASIDVPKDGNLIGVDWAVIASTAGADADVQMQLSFSSVIQLANDGRAAISHVSFLFDFTTSGAGLVYANKYVSLPDIPVAAGERLYLHGSGTAITVTSNVSLHFDFDLDRMLTRRR